MSDWQIQNNSALNRIDHLLSKIEPGGQRSMAEMVAWPRSPIGSRFSQSWPSQATWPKMEERDSRLPKWGDEEEPVPSARFYKLLPDTSVYTSRAGTEWIGWWHRVAGEAKTVTAVLRISVCPSVYSINITELLKHNCRILSTPLPGSVWRHVPSVESNWKVEGK